MSEEKAHAITAEELRVGDRIALGAHTLVEDEVIDFARRWDPQRFHTDPEAAGRGHHGGLFASGIHTLAVLQRLCVESFYSRWSVIAGRGFDKVRFTAPVRPGDTLTGSVIIGDVSLDDSRGRVRLEMEMHRTDATTVLTAELVVFVWRRGLQAAMRDDPVATPPLG